MGNKTAANFHYIVIAALAILLLCHFPITVFAQNFIVAPIQKPLCGYVQLLAHQPAEKKVIRDFVLYNYARVVNDLINGEGMYLDTLYGLLKIEENKKPSLRKAFINILLENKRIPEFSNCIAGYNKSY